MLLDWHMPKLDGLEFLKRLRAEVSLKSQKVTEVDISQGQRAVDAGADDFLGKPFTSEMLAERLRNLGVLES